MIISNILSGNSVSPQFNGKVVNNYALRKFKTGLTEVQADVFEKYVKDIQNANDDKNFIYLPQIIGSRKIGKIHRLDASGNPIDPPMFIDENGDALNIFKQLADRYKHA